MPNNKQNRHVERLSPNEVAAVHVDREYYVNDVPSPYLSRRQASENIEKTRRRQMIISTVLILLLIAAMVAGVGWFVWTTLKPEPTKVVPTYNTATIERMDFVDSIDGTSIVRPIDERGVISEVSGIINEVLVENDKFVEEGEALFVLENASVRETYDKARQALDSAQAEVDKKQAALDAAQKALEEEQNRANGTSGTSSTSTTSETTSSSTSNSSETTSGTTRSTTDQQNTTAGEPSNIAINSSRRFVMQASETQTTSNSTTTSSGQNTSALTKAENRVKNAQRELDEINKTFDTIRETFERAEEQFDRLTVRAPIPGTVSDISSVVVVGNQITGSERLCTVSDLSAYLVQQEIPEERVPQVHEGMEAHLSFPNVADLVIVSSVSEVVENEDGTTHLANIVIDNTDERLTKYMACNSSIIVQAIPNTLVVPLEAICVDEQGNTRLNVLLDPTRGINTYVDVNVIATNATQAVVEADNIQCETSVILSAPGAPAQKAPQPEPQPEPEPEPEGEPDQPEEEPEPQPEEEG